VGGGGWSGGQLLSDKSQSCQDMFFALSIYSATPNANAERFL
jgi:hypothetical protein